LLNIYANAIIHDPTITLYQRVIDRPRFRRTRFVRRIELKKQVDLGGIDAADQPLSRRNADVGAPLLDHPPAVPRARAAPRRLPALGGRT